ISQIAASGAGFAVAGLTTPHTVAAGTSAAVQVTFSPTSATSYTGSISVASNAPDSPLTIVLSGTGTPPPQPVLSAAPATLNFGSVTAGTSSTQTITLTNSGNADANISQVAATGTGFGIAGLTAPYTLAIGKSATVQVTFSPTSATTYAGSISVVSNAPDSPLTVALSGTGTPPPQPVLSAAPATLNFGSVIAGTSSTQTITLTNTGNADASITQVTATGAGFAVAGLTAPYTLAIGKSATVQVTFSPTSAGSYAGRISVISNAPTALSVPLSGTATPPPQPVLSANPATISFPSIIAGTSSNQTVTVANSGNADATISNIAASGSGFSVAGITIPYILKAGSST